MQRFGVGDFMTKKSKQIYETIMRLREKETQRFGKKFLLQHAVGSSWNSSPKCRVSYPRSTFTNSLTMLEEHRNQPWCFFVNELIGKYRECLDISLCACAQVIWKSVTWSTYTWSVEFQNSQRLKWPLNLTCPATSGSNSSTVAYKSISTPPSPAITQIFLRQETTTRRWKTRWRLLQQRNTWFRFSRVSGSL